MRAFTEDGISITNCEECSYVEHDHPNKNCSKNEYRGYLVYQENRDGITPSCPMYESSVEVAE